MAEAEIGIIGGSGLYSMPGLTDVREVALETPFGAPSDAYVLGTLAGRKVAFLAAPRSRTSPDADRAELPRQHPRPEAAWGRARHVAVGRGLAEGRAPAAGFRYPRPVCRSDAASRGYLLWRWAGRRTSDLAIPFVRKKPKFVAEACRRAGVNVKQGGTYLNMEGPQFSTKAESQPVSQLGHGRDRHDQPHRGATGA